MSLSTMSNNNSLNNSNTSTVKESNDVLCRFPAQREREEFPDWLFKAEAYFAAKNMLDIIRQPIHNMPAYRSSTSTSTSNSSTSSTSSSSVDNESHESYDAGVSFVGKNLNHIQYEQLVHKAAKAYNYLIQSLNNKQIELVRHVYQGNAYMVMHRLKKNYGIIKSTTTTMALLGKLNTNRKINQRNNE
jgi:hypothetical protein